MELKKVAIQGIVGSFHEEAAHKFFGDEIQTIECNTFRDLAQIIDKEEVDFGMMAIENTIAGSLLANYSLMREYHLKIIGEQFIHIHMNLMALPGVKIEDLSFITSHPIALAQSAEYLYTLKHATLVEHLDTAAAAKDISDKGLTNTAAVASATAAKLYGLNILEKNIETNKKNYTRFLVLSKHIVNGAENNKATICFELGHYIGALANVLMILSDNKINLTKIQSVPIIGKPYEYIFHVDIEYDKSEFYEKALKKILRNVSSFSVLGEYKKGGF